MKPAITLRTVAAFVTVTLVWGSTWLVIKDQISLVPPGWSVTWRFAVAALGMFALALVRRESVLIDRPTMLLAAVLGLLQFFGNFQFVYGAERYVTSGLVAVLYALLMVPNAILARLFLGARVSKRFLAGTAIALVGISALLLHEFRAAPKLDAVALGIGLTLCGLLCASAANVLQATERARSAALIPMLAWAMVWGTLGDGLYSLMVWGPPVFDPRPQYIFGTVYLGLIGSVLTFPLYFALIRDWGPSRAAYNGVAVPVVAMGLSTLFEGYRWSWLAGAGAVIALTGLLVALSGRSSEPSPSR